MAAEAVEQPAAEVADEGKKLWIRFLAGAGAVAVVVLLLVWQGGKDPAADTGGAKRACEGFVRDQLKAPATADFSSEDVTANSPLYTVTGAVDAENSFGAKLRSRFTCVVYDDGTAWRLQSLTGL